jgi:hypothetical protein
METVNMQQCSPPRCGMDLKKRVFGFNRQASIQERFAKQATSYGFPAEGGHHVN